MFSPVLRTALVALPALFLATLTGCTVDDAGIFGDSSTGSSTPGTGGGTTATSSSSTSDGGGDDGVQLGGTCYLPDGFCVAEHLDHQQGDPCGGNPQGVHRSEHACLGDSPLTGQDIVGCCDEPDRSVCSYQPGDDGSWCISGAWVDEGFAKNDCNADNCGPGASECQVDSCENAQSCVSKPAPDGTTCSTGWCSNGACSPRRSCMLPGGGTCMATDDPSFDVCHGGGTVLAGQCPDAHRAGCCSMVKDGFTYVDCSYQDGEDGHTCVAPSVWTPG